MDFVPAFQRMLEYKGQLHVCRVQKFLVCECFCNFHLSLVANPGQPCSQTIQCAGGWPGATCSTSNVCACPASYTAFQTQDGYVCAKVGMKIYRTEILL